MPSGAGFARTVTTADLTALGLSVEIQGFVNGGREHDFYFFFYLLTKKNKKKTETNCMLECRLPKFCLHFDCYYLFLIKKSRFAHGRVMCVRYVSRATVERMRTVT